MAQRSGQSQSDEAEAIYKVVKRDINKFSHNWKDIVKQLRDIATNIEGQKKRDVAENIFSCVGVCVSVIVLGGWGWYFGGGLVSLLRPAIGVGGSVGLPKLVSYTLGWQTYKERIIESAEFKKLKIENIESFVLKEDSETIREIANIIEGHYKTE